MYKIWMAVMLAASIVLAGCGGGVRNITENCSFPVGLKEQYSKTTKEIYDYMVDLEAINFYVHEKTYTNIESEFINGLVSTSFLADEMEKFESYMKACLSKAPNNIRIAPDVPALKQAIESIDPTTSPDGIAKEIFRREEFENIHVILTRHFNRASGHAGHLHYKVVRSGGGSKITTPFKLPPIFLWGENWAEALAADEIPLYKNLPLYQDFDNPERETYMIREDKLETVTYIPRGDEFIQTPVLDLYGYSVGTAFRVHYREYAGYVITRPAR